MKEETAGAIANYRRAGQRTSASSYPRRLCDSAVIRFFLSFLILLAAACLAHAETAKPSQSRTRAEAARDDAKLVAQFKAGSAGTGRTDEQLQADADRAVKLLLAAVAEAGSSRYRAAQARADLEQVCLRSLSPSDDRARR